MGNVASSKPLSWRDPIRAFFQRYPAIARPIWNAYYSLFPGDPKYHHDGGGEDRAQAFSEIFSGNEWRCEETRSGRGSTLADTGQVRKYLPGVINRYRVKTLLDAPCGDFNWMKLVDLPQDVSYIGADIVPDLIDDLSRRFGAANRRFVKLDVVEEPLPDADMWLCRHLSYHLSDKDMIGLLRNFKRSNIKYILTTDCNFPRENVDIISGGYRYANLKKPPFNLPKPLSWFDDYVLLGPPNVLAVWAREQIPDL